MTGSSARRVAALEERLARGDDVLGELRALEAELTAAAPEVLGDAPAVPGDGLAARLDSARAHLRAGPLPLAADSPQPLVVLSARLAAMPIGAAADAAVQAALAELEDRARAREADAQTRHAAARRAELHATALEALAALLERLDRLGRSDGTDPGEAA